MKHRLPVAGVTSTSGKQQYRRNAPVRLNWKHDRTWFSKFKWWVHCHSCRWLTRRGANLSVKLAASDAARATAAAAAGKEFRVPIRRNKPVLRLPDWEVEDKKKG